MSCIVYAYVLDFKHVLKNHLNAVKRIFRYLKGTIDIGLWYPKNDSFELTCYLDADFSGCKIDRKNTSGTCHFLGHSCLGIARNKIQLHCQRLKPNT